jgi:hypothetical protein
MMHNVILVLQAHAMIMTMISDLRFLLGFFCRRSDRERIQIRVENEELGQQVEQLSKAKVSKR